MRFSDQFLWWGEKKRRNCPHEGMDYATYLTHTGHCHSIMPGLAVPGIFDGQVARLLPDFLAWTVFVQHAQYQSDLGCLFSVYAHLQPAGSLNAGQKIVQGDLLGTVESFTIQARVPLHLHFTVAWIKPGVSLNRLDWELLNDAEWATLMNPLAVFRV